MKVKRYIGETVQDAMQKVKMELGRDAIIINTRKVRKRGIAGLFTKPLIEVIATIDNYEKPLSNKTNIVSQPEKSEQNIQNDYLEKTIEKQLNEIYKNDEANKSIKNMELEFNEIKSMVSKVYSIVRDDDEKISEIVKTYLSRLRNNEVEEEIILKIKESINAKLTIEMQEDENIVRNFIHNILFDFFPTHNEDLDSNFKKVMIFVGPTGVGKTTTLAKLAAVYSLSKKKKVGFITSDTYRIAAVEQLKTYSEIIGVPISVIYSPLEFYDAVEKFKEKDIIMVDTAGRSHKDKYQLMELKPLLNAEDIDRQVYLVISATTKMADCKEIIESYNFLEDYKFLFTKIDETSSTGILLNAPYITKKPLSYVTIGQNVPDDIEIADVNKIINSLLGDKIYERSS